MRRTPLIALAAGIAALAGAPADAATGSLHPCSSETRAIVTPKEIPTGLNVNEHRSWDIEYRVTQCDLRVSDLGVWVQGLDNRDALTATFSGGRDGVAFLHLEAKRDEIPAGTTAVKLVIGSELIRTSTLTLTIDKHSSAWAVFGIGVIGLFVGLAVFGAQSFRTGKKGWRVWYAFRPPIWGVVIVGAAAAAVIGIGVESFSSHWSLHSDWWKLLGTMGGASIGAAATGSALAKAAGK
ncbi:MAG: hypothetical protein ABSB96_00880 [Gaiellaceae bacterium]